MQKRNDSNKLMRWNNYLTLFTTLLALLANSQAFAQQPPKTECPLRSNQAAGAPESCPNKPCFQNFVRTLGLQPQEGCPSRQPCATGSVVIFDSPATSSQPAQQLGISVPCCNLMEQPVWSALGHIPAGLIVEALQVYLQHRPHARHTASSHQAAQNPHVHLAAFINETRQTVQQQNQELQHVLTKQQKHIEQLTDKMDTLVREIQSLRQQVQTLRQQSPAYVPMLPPYPYPSPYYPQYHTPRYPLPPALPPAPTTWNAPAPLLTTPPASMRPASYGPFGQPAQAPNTLPAPHRDFPVPQSAPLPAPSGLR